MKSMKVQAIDPSEFVSKAHACRMSGVSVVELNSMIRSGLIGVLKIPGRQARIRLADIDRALRFLSVPSLIPEESLT